MPTCAAFWRSNRPNAESLLPWRAVFWCVAICAAVATPALAQTDFKLKIMLHKVGDSAPDVDDLLFHHGKLYRLRARSKELLAIDFASQQIDLIDIAAERRMRTSLMIETLEDMTAKLRTALLKGIEKREQDGGKPNLITARIARALMEPQLAEKFDASSGTLRLSSERAEVVAAGVADPDPSRLDALLRGLSVMARLDWVREPESLPPYTEITALGALLKYHRLRPRELSITYQFAGNVRRDRWTFEFTPELTERDIEALSRLNAFRRQATYFSFSRYESRGPH